MSFSAYNLKNQKLSSDSLRTLLQFCSDNYAGAIYSNTEENPIKINSGEVSFDADEVDFVVGGYLLHYSSQQSPITSVSPTENSPLFGLVINQTAVENSTLMTSNIISVRVGLISNINNSSVTVNTNSQDNETLYQILYGDTIWNYKEDTKIFDSVIVSGDNITGGTIYIIPLAAYSNNTGSVVSLLGYRTKSALEEYLTRQALDDLMAIFESKFTWKAGGEIDGDIGQLNITADTISSKTGTIHLGNPLNLGVSNANKALMTDNSGNIVADILPVSKGGTGGTDTISAKNNLGIYWGTTLPSASSYQNGDIFLKIIS